MDPPEIVNGERLFLETRFAQYFYAHSGGDANFVLVQGDSVLDQTETTSGSMPGPFAGQSMNCRACHFVDEFLNTDEEGNFIPGDPSNLLMKTYSDFARRSPIPDRAEDNATHAPRNSPPLVNASFPRPFDSSFHFDGEFASMEDLVFATLTGRNYGWLPVELNNAIHHIANIIRHDDGLGDLAQEFGGIPYFDLFTRNDLPAEFQLPAEFLISPGASDQEIIDAVARVIAAYVTDLSFSQDANGNFNLSPYDRFLEINKLPRQPGKNQSDLDYSQSLLKKIRHKERAGKLRFVHNNQHGPFIFHDQKFRFGPKELEGLKIFFTSHGKNGKKSGGNCITCHSAPAFSDFKFHNTGTTQKEYDRIHGTGAFSGLHIPGLKERQQNHNTWLPPTALHPNATGIFRSIPSADNVSQTDLGLWNIFANQDFPNPQKRLWRHLCEQAMAPEKKGPKRHRPLHGSVFKHCRPQNLLPLSIALFKTPGLRDLGHSAPYFHNGQEDTLKDVIHFYREMSNLARAGKLRNGSHELKNIKIKSDGIKPLVRFLKSLNEDYE